MASKPTYPGLPPIMGGVTLVNADGAAAYKDIYTAPSGSGDQGVLLGRLRAVSDDTVACNILFALQIGGTDYPIGVAQVPVGAGTGANVPWKNILADINLSEALELAPGAVLRAKPLVAVTATKTVTISWVGAPLE